MASKNIVDGLFERPAVSKASGRSDARNVLAYDGTGSLCAHCPCLIGWQFCSMLDKCSDAELLPFAVWS